MDTSAVKWFTPEQLESHIEKQSVLSYEQAKKTRDKLKIQNAVNRLISIYRSHQEIYRQLKFASQKQGDTPLSLDFQRHEMNYYRKIIAIRKPREWSEHIILLTNQTNNFGQNWLKAFILLVLFSFLSYIPIGFFTSDKLDYSKLANSLSDIWLNVKVISLDNLKEWMIILNPTHRLKDLNENLDKYSSWIYFWDIISRVIVSYFIFQTISAFRKFSK